MKKILIFGNSGAGKSTLAKNLTQKLNLSHLDLDTLAWSDSSPPARKPLIASTNEIDTFLDSTSDWIIEGCYADLLQYVTRHASEIIFLNPGTEVCINHCKQRPLESHKYASKEAQDDNLEMLIEWVKQYENRDDEFSLKQHKHLFESFSGKKTEVTSENFSYK